MNAERIRKIFESVQSSLDDEIFVVENADDLLLKSSLYTFDGFKSSLLFYSMHGVRNSYIYLGEDESSEESQGFKVDYGLANVALFLAKMMSDAIAYERCDSNLLASRMTCTCYYFLFTFLIYVMLCSLAFT